MDGPRDHRGHRRPGVRREGRRPLLRVGLVDARTTIGLRTARYQLVRWASGAVELYDLERDPNELTNVVHDPAYASVRDHLTRLWWRYRDCTGAGCTRELPVRFRAAADEVEAATIRQRAGVEAFVGELLTQRDAL